MNIKRVVLFTLVGFTFGISFATNKPNIILIMADDLGAESVGCYGNTNFSTPNIDRLAAQGARFDNTFATPACTPSRAMLMTGLYANRSGFLERIMPLTKSRLPAHIPTFSKLFQNNGYKTAIAGKWHLGDFHAFPDHPAVHGFDTYCMWADHYIDKKYERYFGPGVWQNGQFIQHEKEVYGPNLYCDFILDFIEENKDEPFLAYYPMTLVHKDFHTPPLVDESIKHFCHEDAEPVDKTFGLMIAYMDRLVGRIMDKLNELELADNTIIIFTSDNGNPNAITSWMGDLQVNGGKMSLIEAGSRVPFIVRWPGNIPVGVRKHFLMMADIYPTLAALSNIPMDAEVDGMNLSHLMLNKSGTDRELAYLAWEAERYYVRNDRFRLHQNGDFYEIPVSSDAARYSENKVPMAKFPEEASRLQEKLNKFMGIKKTDDSYKLKLRHFKNNLVRPIGVSPKEHDDNLRKKRAKAKNK